MEPNNTQPPVILEEEKQAIPANKIFIFCFFLVIIIAAVGMLYYVFNGISTKSTATIPLESHKIFPPTEEPIAPTESPVNITEAEINSVDIGSADASLDEINAQASSL